MLYPLAARSFTESAATWSRFEQALTQGKTPVALTGIAEGQKAYIAARLCAEGHPVLMVTPAEEVTSRVADEISRVRGEKTLVLPGRGAALYAEAASRELTLRRIEALASMLCGGTFAAVASIESLMAPLVPAEAFSASLRNYKEEEMPDPVEMIRELSEAGYIRVEKTEAPGQFSVRGDILDIFGVGYSDPVRVEYFGDEVDSMRTFDIQSQRSLERIHKLRLLPANEVPLARDVLLAGIERLNREKDAAIAAIRKIEAKVLREHGGKVPEQWMRRTAEERPENRIDARVRESIDALLTCGTYSGIVNDILCFYPEPASIADYLPENTVILLDEPQRISERSRNVGEEYGNTYLSAMEGGRALPNQARLMRDSAVIFSEISLPMVQLQNLTTAMDPPPRSLVSLQGIGMHTIRGQFNMLKGDIERWRETGTRAVLMGGTGSRAEHLKKSLAENGVHIPLLTEDRALLPGECVILPMDMTEGFEDYDWRCAVVGERELYGVVHSKNRSVSARKKGTGYILLDDLKMGDYVVHESHGIGRYEGIVQLAADGNTRDYIRIAYRGEDVLYVPTEQLDRIQRYVGNEDTTPALNRLGGDAWKNAKARASRAIQDMTDELVKLYASRQAGKGFAFSPDTPWQRQMEADFPYEATADQLRSIEEIKDDMESSRVMDRLLCGDVGFGKTEVALRAIFKAVMDHKQVAFLAPTTILAHQHFQTLCERFREYGVRVGELSRFRTPVQIRETISALKSGLMDVVVGTHRLLSKDVVFKDLGLLVVDEEQRFGVGHKEKIKEMRASVDVLTLTATPIPRTLNMSMTGIRDISVIDTPPEERFPVQTMVMEYDESVIRDAILRELGRDGQVYFVYNRVETIDIMKAQLQALVPDARIVVGHGQMPERELEKVMTSVLEGEADILLATTIIESGLDIPRVNTLIVYDADHFGLAQLYQIRGRVGRSNRLAYAYLTYRPSKVLSETAEKRLTAIREFTEFGSGFKVAMRDLEIRGAGNLLGAEQSGHMASIGYGMYCKLVEEAVAKIRGEEHAAAPDPVLELKTDAFIPDTYIRDSASRLEVYRRISAIRNEDDLRDAQDELIDRFGDIPAEVVQLIRVAYLRSLCMSCGIERIRQTVDNCLVIFNEHASIDPVRLFGLLEKNRGKLFLAAQKPPTLRYRPSSTEKAVAELADVCSQIILCIADKT